jgi:hypothetical protein
MPADTETRDGNWRVINNFDHQSRSPYSSASGQTKRPADPGIIRSMRGYIEQEGHFDITYYDAEQLAQLLGWAPPEKLHELLDRIAELEVEAELVRSVTWKKAQDAVRMASVRDAK